MCGTHLRVKFLSITNIGGVLYAKFDVIKPKTLLLDGCIVDLTKLGEYSKSLGHGLFVGVEQRKQDSLYVACGQTKTWTLGHTGYFSVEDLLFNEPKIYKILNAPSCWDGGWEEEDVIDKLSKEEIQYRIDKYKEHKQYWNLMKSRWKESNSIEDFIKQCRDISVIMVKAFIEEQRYWTCDNCSKRVTALSPLVDTKTLEVTKKVCLDCVGKYKQLYLHGITADNKPTSGALLRESNVLIAEEDMDKPKIETAIHICAELEKVNGRYVWVIKEPKTQTVEIDGKIYPLTINKQKSVNSFIDKCIKSRVTDEVYELKFDPKKGKVVDFKQTF